MTPKIVLFEIHPISDYLACNARKYKNLKLSAMIWYKLQYFSIIFKVPYYRKILTFWWINCKYFWDFFTIPHDAKCSTLLIRYVSIIYYYLSYMVRFNICDNRQRVEAVCFSIVDACWGSGYQSSHRRYRYHLWHGLEPAQRHPGVQSCSPHRTEEPSDDL